MTRILKDIAEIQVGYSFRVRLEPHPHGELAVIQMKDLENDDTVNCAGLIRISGETLAAHHYVRPGDLVFRSRGNSATAAIIQDDPGDAIVSAPLLRIRVLSDTELLPRYLAWYIAQRDAQSFLASRARGTTQKMITKQELEELPVVLPPLQAQVRIVELAELERREQCLLSTLAEKRKHYIANLLMEYAQGAES